MINNRYQIHEELGAGGMGAVYRATDRLAGTVVALKRIRTELGALQFKTRLEDSRSEHLLLLFAREFTMLAGLRHPHIIAVQDYGFIESEPYFTMTYVPGARSLVQAGADLSTLEKLRLLRPVVEALMYLHRRGVLHRDLKPANVLVDAQGRVRVLDFGLAIEAQQVAHRGGTVAYMAPEVLRGGAVSEATDLYAVGVMAYELLTGRLPFSPSDIFGIISRPPTMAPVHPLVAPLIQRLLAKDPAARYPDAAALIADINQLLDEATRPEDTAIRESFLQAARFVGRDEPMQRLLGALAASKSGATSTWLVGGESGVGKSRLLEEVRIRALVDGVTVVRGQAVEGGPYQVWRDPLRHLLLAVPVSDVEAGVLAEVVPDIGTLLGREVSPLEPLEAPTHLRRLINTILDVVARAAADQPLLLLLEDLQWANLAPLKALSRLEGLTLLVLGSYRDDEHPDLAQQVPGAHDLRLGRLAAADIGRLTKSMLGEQNPALVALLQRETEGNAFFLVESVRALAEEAGYLREVGHGELPPTIVASGVQQVLQRRLDRVPAWGQPLLQVAAVVGRQVDLTLLEGLSDGVDVEGWLTACANAAVFDVQDGTWRFAHDKLREKLYAGLEPTVRAALHRRVALALEADDEPPVLALCHHWRAAGDDAKEVQYLPDAVALSSKAGAHAAARDYGQRVLTLTDDLAIRGLVHFRLGDVASQLGDNDGAIFHLQRAIDYAVQRGDGPLHARALQRCAVIRHYGGDAQTAWALGQQSLALARQSGDAETECMILKEMGWIRFQNGDYEAARSYLEAALALAPQVSVRTRIAPYSDIAGVLIYMGRYAEARANLQVYVDHKRALGEQLGLAIGLSNLVELNLVLGDFEPCQAFYEEANAIFLRYNNRRARASLLNIYGGVLGAQERREEARELYDQALAIFRAANFVYGIVQSLNNLGYVTDDTAYFHEALPLAWKSNLIPETLRAVAGLADEQPPLTAIRWLNLARSHPASFPTLQEEIAARLAFLRDQVAPTDYEAALADPLDLEAVVSGLLDH